MAIKVIIKPLVSMSNLLNNSAGNNTTGSRSARTDQIL